MTDTLDAIPAITHSPEPWDCDARTTMYATPDDSDEVPLIEVRAKVTEVGWDTVAFIDAAWPRSGVNARRICAAVNACKGISSEALEQGLVASQRLALQELATAAANLLAAIEDATGQFDSECARLDAACTTARAVLQSAAAITIRELLAGRRRIALVWSVEDVLHERPDLTAEQAWKVLQEVAHGHDAEYGVSWGTLVWYADNLFGKAPETDEA